MNDFGRILLKMNDFRWKVLKMIDFVEIAYNERIWLKSA
ncbi:hypothetical protein T03_450 [Trichinella britovi]|uniref:Uncharacterized protein n=1 Tax=Trichinella britovi TaxID=45882 RepID=A0A0V0Z4Y0_TRIBR|nr:hypothetical protein T03_450 [Trichinella britovi]